MIEKKAGDDLLEKFEELRIYNIGKFLSSPAEFNWGILVRTQEFQNATRNSVNKKFAHVSDCQ